MNVAFEEAMNRLGLVAVEAGRRSAEIEAARALPSDLVDALIDTGVFRLTVPVDIGGVGVGASAVARAARSVAYHDGSTAWVVMSALVASAGASALPRHHAATVLGDPRTIVVGPGQGPGASDVGGTGRLTDDGGLVVNGRWSWGSGVAAASWVGADVRIEDVDAFEEPAAASLVRCLFRRDQVVALDTWHAVGLRGTGSTDFQVTEAFVPEGRWVAIDDDPASGHVRRPSEDLIAVGAAAVALGLAARAMDDVAPGATPVGAETPVDPANGTGTNRGGDRSAGRAERARLGAALAAADAILDRSISDLGADVAHSTSPVPRSGVVAAAIHGVETAVRVVEHCYRAGGPAAVLHASPLQRLLRDVQVVAQHPAVAPTRWERLGSVEPPAT